MKTRQYSKLLQMIQIYLWKHRIFDQFHGICSKVVQIIPSSLCKFDNHQRCASPENDIMFWTTHVILLESSLQWPSNSHKNYAQTIENSFWGVRNVCTTLPILWNSVKDSFRVLKIVPHQLKYISKDPPIQTEVCWNILKWYCWISENIPWKNPCFPEPVIFGEALLQ